jgi:ribosomal protein S2
MSKRIPISQREAIRNKRELKKLQEKLDSVTSMWPGTTIISVKSSDAMYHSVQTARTLGYTVIANEEVNNDKEKVVRFRAIKLT